MKKPPFKSIAIISVLLSWLLLALPAFSQKVVLPDIPTYDSTHVMSHNESITAKKYYRNGILVFEIEYRVDGSYSSILGTEKDSCYLYFNGPNQDQFDIYYFSGDIIRNDRYGYHSKIFQYRKYNRNNVPVESGNLYLVKDMATGSIDNDYKYRIGKWIKYDAKGNDVETIDYDKSTINGKPIVFTGKTAIIESLKSVVDNKITEVYGKKFFRKHIRFNLYRSGYYEHKDISPYPPGGWSLLRPTEKEILFVDLSYDIILGDERFNVIHFRLSKEGEMLGKTQFPPHYRKDYYLTQGLDSLNNGKFHKQILKWEEVAADNGFDITHGDFNVKFQFEPTSDLYGELRMVLEQITETKSTRHSSINKIKQLVINPWNGELKESSSEEGIEIDIGGFDL